MDNFDDISGSDQTENEQNTTTETTDLAASCGTAAATQETASSGAESSSTEKSAEKKPQKEKLQTGMVVFILILAVVGIAGVYSLVNKIINPDRGSVSVNFSTPTQNFPFFSSKDISASAVGTFHDDYIAVLKIEGTIEQENTTYNQKWLLETVTALKEDTKNKALLLFIDSPGGTVYEADELYLALNEYKETTGNPVWAYLGSMAASGGYYIACAADRIIANRNTLTGSIGVLYGPAVDLTKLMDEYGIKMTTFKAGKNKNMLNINSPVTEEQTAIMQSIVDEAYEQFTGIVSKSRNITIQATQQLADGRVYTAKQAKELDLIDDIKGYSEAIEFMQQDLFGDTDIDVNDIKMSIKKTLYDYILESEMMFSQKARKDPVSSLINQISVCPAGPAYYYQFGME